MPTFAQFKAALRDKIQHYERQNQGRLNSIRALQIVKLHGFINDRKSNPEKLYRQVLTYTRTIVGYLSWWDALCGNLSPPSRLASEIYAVLDDPKFSLTEMIKKEIRRTYSPETADKAELIRHIEALEAKYEQVLSRNQELESKFQVMNQQLTELLADKQPPRSCIEPEQGPRFFAKTGQ